MTTGLTIRQGLLAAAFAGLVTAVVHVGAQGQATQGQQPTQGQPTPGQAPPAQSPQQNPPPGQAPPAQLPQPQPGGAQGPPGRGAGGQEQQQGRGRGRGPGVFPAMQRPPADPAVIERGKAIFSGACSACHGPDARGGQLGGPNLLRSQLVLADQDGEQIMPVIQNGRPERGMPPIPIPADDQKAVVEYIHSLTAASQGQGSPPPTEAPPPNIVVGDATAGQAYFQAKCATCHSVSGDLQGIATKVADPKALQNLWVSGGLASGGGRGGRGRGGPPPEGPKLTAAITLSSGEKVQGRLVRYDDFLVTIEMEDGSLRSFRRDGDRPALEINNPLRGHTALLAELTDKDMRNVTAYLVTLK